MILPQSKLYETRGGGFEPPMMLSPVEVASRFRLPEHFVRELVRNGSVVSVRAGRRILINVDSVQAYLETGISQGSLSENEVQMEDVAISSNGRLAPIQTKP